MNKQEKNIVDILTFDNTEDIVSVFINKVYNDDKTVALITNKDLVEYAMDELLNDDYISVRRVDIELDDVEYMISVNNDGNMVVQPIEYYDNKYFMNIKYAFIDMDGCISQMTIDRLLDRDVSIVLFGYDDEEECGCDCCKCNNDIHIKTDGDMHGFSVNHSGENGYSSYSFYSTDMKLVNEMAKIFR